MLVRMQRNWNTHTLLGAGGNVKWYSHSVKQFGSFLGKCNYHASQQLHSWAFIPKK